MLSPPAARAGGCGEEWRRGGRCGGGGRVQGSPGSRGSAGGGAGTGPGHGAPSLAMGWLDTEALLLVRLEHVGETEALAAHVAGVGPPVCVRPVPLHKLGRLVASAADFADVGLSCRVGGMGLGELLGATTIPHPQPVSQPPHPTLGVRRPGLSTPVEKGRGRMPAMARKPSLLDMGTCVGLHVLIKVLLHMLKSSSHTTGT